MNFNKVLIKQRGHFVEEKLIFFLCPQNFSRTLKETFLPGFVLVQCVDTGHIRVLKFKSSKVTFHFRIKGIK